MTQAGALGVIIQRFDHYGADIWDKSDMPDIIPGLWYCPTPKQGSLQYLRDLLREGRVLDVTMTAPQENVWIDYAKGPGGIIYQVIISIFLYLLCI